MGPKKTFDFHNVPNLLSDFYDQIAGRKVTRTIMFQDFKAEGVFWGSWSIKKLENRWGIDEYQYRNDQQG